MSSDRGTARIRKAEGHALVAPLKGGGMVMFSCTSESADMANVFIEEARKARKIIDIQDIINAVRSATPGDDKMTTGEYRVGIAFNPGGNEMVNKIKRAAADLIDLTETIPGEGEVARLKALAMTHIEDAAMWAVKAATKPAR